MYFTVQVGRCVLRVRLEFVRRRVRTRLGAFNDVNGHNESFIIYTLTLAPYFNFQYTKVYLAK